MDRNLSKLNLWLSLPGNSFPVLASLLKYDADNTIRMWFRRGSIPKRELEKVMEVIDGDIIKSGQKRKSDKAASGSGVRT